MPNEPVRAAAVANLVTIGDRAPSEETLRGWLSSLSNWGRWGATDERGTLNLIEPEDVREAAALVESGTQISCSIPIRYDREPHGVSASPGAKESWKGAPHRFVIPESPGTASDTAGFSSDAFLIAPHGSRVTHLDAPSHIVYRGTAYNGLRPSGDGDPLRNAGSVTQATDGIIGRGVLLDVPAALGRDWLDDGEGILPEHLAAAEARGGVSVGRGDLLLVRTGYRKRNPTGAATGRPGLNAACLPWLRERDVAVLGSDVTHDIGPHGYGVGAPIHLVGIWAMGLWLIDNGDFERLASACARIGRWEFLLAIQPLVLTGGTGSPVNPVAIF